MTSVTAGVGGSGLAICPAFKMQKMKKIAALDNNADDFQWKYCKKIDISDLHLR